MGIPVVKDLPGVGSNFQDHLEVSIYLKTRDPISLLGQDTGLAAVKHYLSWKLFRKGLLTSNVVESGGFVDLDGDGRAELQFHVLPVLVGDADRAPLPGHWAVDQPVLHSSQVAAAPCACAATKPTIQSCSTRILWPKKRMCGLWSKD